MLHPEWSYQAVIYEMNVRQLTREGTLRAAAAKLGFLRDMGIDAVWLMPVYPIRGAFISPVWRIFVLFPADRFGTDYAI